ncbi:branched-chain amino acid ABC transporter permease [Dactylosporangium sp. CA-092794]|uniref:branched-chain amino acid ABC transporter permease n=1 Tax=Dactylosporangium sp. CA-092794 TaxID=3239929 RepID=UPI003D8B9168
MIKFEAALNGVLLLSAVYGLLSLGMVLIFRATRVLNFSAGALGLVGAYFVYELGLLLGNFYAGLVLGLVASLAFGAVVYRFVLAPISGSRASIGATTDVGVVLGTIILAEALGAAVPFFTGSSGREVKIPLPGWTWHGGGFNLNMLQIVAFAAMVVVVAAIAIGSSRLSIGLGMRAAADSPRLAGLTGISTRRVAAVSWALATAVGTLGVVAYAASSVLEPATVAGLGAALFPALLLGGLDSIIGCVVGAVLLAFIQSASAVYLGGHWMSVSPYMFLLAVLIFKPHGFFGRGEFSRL